MIFTTVYSVYVTQKPSFCTGGWVIVVQALIPGLYGIKGTEKEHSDALCCTRPNYHYHHEKTLYQT